MSASISSQPAGLDRLMGFSIPARNVRGRIVRLGPLLDRILGAHDYPPAIKCVLAEALALTSLIGGLLKRDANQLTMQAQAEGGAIGLLVCDYRDGELRGYVRHDAKRLAVLEGKTALDVLFGRGHLAITFDLGDGSQPYQGVVPLEGESLAHAVEAYFERSEQLPTLIRSATHMGDRGCVAGAILVQHLADGEEGRERLHVRVDHPDWEHVAIMAGSVRAEELVDPAIPFDEIAWRLFHEEQEVRVQETASLTRGCRCSVQHFEQVLARFPKEDRREMRNDSGFIVVDCAFCSREFPIED